MRKKINSLLIIRKSSSEIDWILPVLEEMKNEVNFYTLFLNQKAFESLKNNKFLFQKWKKINKNFYIQKKLDKFFFKILRFFLEKILFKKKINFFNKYIHDTEFLKKKLNIKKISFNFILNEFQKISYWYESLREINKNTKLFLFPHTTHIYFYNKENLLKKTKSKITNCDGLFLGSSLDKKIWSMRTNLNNINITGHPKYSKNWQAQFKQKKKKKFIKIVFVLKNIIDETSYFLTLNYLNQVYKICLKKNYFLDIKIPPFQQDELVTIIEKFKINKNKNRFQISDQNIFNSLNNADVLINFNLSATSLDAISLNVPVIQLPVINKKKGRFGKNESIYTKLNLVYCAEDIEKLEKKIFDIIKNKKEIIKDLRKKKLKYFPNHNNSSKNIKKIILKKIQQHK